MKAVTNVARRYIPDFPSPLLDLGDGPGEVEVGNVGKVHAVLSQIRRPLSVVPLVGHCRIIPPREGFPS